MSNNKDAFNQKIQHYVNRWVYVFSGIIIMMCIGTVYSYSIFRNPIENTFNVGNTLSGLPYMTALSFYAIFMFITGKFLDKHKPRNIIFVGGLFVALGWILSAFANNIYMLTITYGLISGSGVGIVYGVPMAVVAKWFPDKKGLAVGTVLIGFGLSPLVTAPLAKLIVEQYGIMDSFMVLGICFGLLISLLSLLFKYPTNADVSSRSPINTTNILSGTNTQKMIKSTSFWGLYINFIIGTMIGLMIIGMTSSIALKLFEIPEQRVPFFISLFALFNGIARPVFGWLTDKLASKKVILISYGLIALAAVLPLIFKEKSIIIFLISFSIFWLNLGAWLAIAPTSTLSLFGVKHYSQNYGLVFTGYGIGAVLGVITSGIIVDTLNNYNYLFFYVIGLCLAGILLTLKLIKPTGKQY